MYEYEIRHGFSRSDFQQLRGVRHDLAQFLRDDYGNAFLFDVHDRAIRKRKRFGSRIRETFRQHELP